MGYGGLADRDEEAPTDNGRMRPTVRGRMSKASMLDGMDEQQKAALAQAVVRQRGSISRDELRDMGLMD